MLENRAIYLQGLRDQEGETTAAGILLDPVWDLNICHLVEGSDLLMITAGLLTAERRGKKYVHVQNFPGHSDQAFLHALRKALESGITVLISSFEEPPVSMHSLTIWYKALPVLQPPRNND